MEACSDMTTFSSIHGQSELNEKLAISNNLKSEWRCSQVTTIDAFLNEQNEKPELIPLQSTDELEKFKLVRTVNSEPNVEADNKAGSLPNVSLPTPIECKKGKWHSSNSIRHDERHKSKKVCKNQELKQSEPKFSPQNQNGK